MFYLEADHFISLPVVYWDSFLGDSSTYKAFAVPFLLLCHVRLFVTPWTVAHQTPLSMGFSRQEYWSGLPFPSPGDFPDPGIEPMSLVSRALAGIFFTIAPPGYAI